MRRAYSCVSAVYTLVNSTTPAVFRGSLLLSHYNLWSDWLQETIPSTQILPPESARDFFFDCPWLAIPEHRQAEIIIQPIYPRGGLLGGSSRPAKMSKLAALAAKRRQKENENPHAASPIPAESDDYATRLKNLKISAEENKRDKDIKSANKDEAPPLSELPIKQDEKTEANLAKTDPANRQSEAIVGRAIPSMFAKTLFANRTTYSIPANLKFPDPISSESWGPSPDDVINKAQRDSKRS